ncbi:thrombospondin type 3 repeat-containing protein [Halorubellus sp. PRR65]|uniref:thrombospondin type 3 repeat-containing protein n=1 Tax=Halorubellus sp. PRR65 TaxID=3098148 RepID=UPI002B260600|nr:thrombospondin type 3 repeat-containing protein [Halorubellus sp. PRR65]
MSWTRKQRITVVAIILLVVTVPVIWQIDDVRATLATEKAQSDLVGQAVPERQAPADYDGDGIDDSTDECPTRPEETNGFQDSDGCPDVVATTGAS